MYFGDITGLDALSGRLSQVADTVESARQRGESMMGEMVAGVVGPEVRAAEAFAARWSDVGSALRGLVTAASDASQIVSILGDRLRSATSQWNAVLASISYLHPAIDVYGTSVSVTVSAAATPAQVQAASDAQVDLESAYHLAQESWNWARSQLENLRLPSAAGDLVVSEVPVTIAESGDAGVDDELRRIVPGLLAVHQKVLVSK